MHIKKLVPDGWPCPLSEIPPGHFIILKYPDMLCFRSEYNVIKGKLEVFNGAGEYSNVDQSEMCQAVRMIVEECEE